MKTILVICHRRSFYFYIIIVISTKFFVCYNVWIAFQCFNFISLRLQLKLVDGSGFTFHMQFIELMYQQHKTTNMFYFRIAQPLTPPVRCRNRCILFEKSISFPSKLSQSDSFNVNKLMKKILPRRKPEMFSTSFYIRIKLFH